LVSLLGAVVLFHRFDKQRYQREREDGEESLVRALLDAQQVDRHIEQARLQRERQLQYDVLADQVRAQTLARAQQEGLLNEDLGSGSGTGSGLARDPPPYGTFDSSPRKPKNSRNGSY
jgi:hypothetical protein